MTALLLLAAAGALVGIGIVLRGRGERAARAAGVTLVAATIYASAAALSIATQTSSTYAIANIVAAAVGLVAAIAVRRFHPSVVTHAAALGWTVALGVALLQLIQDQLLTTDTGLPAAGGPGPIALSLASAVFWLALAVGIGLIGLAEARSAAASGSRAAARRAALSRFWAGMTAVIGVYSALTRSGVLENDEYGRIIEPIVAEIALVVLAAVLLERAFRREATSFMYAAALGLILALTDLNVSYLSDRAEVALLVEGLILLGVGFVANRLRRTIVGSTGPDGVGSGIPADVPPASGLADLAPDPANLP